MYFGQADIVTRTDLQTELSALELVLPIAGPLATELGAAAAAVQWWPVDDGGVGVSVSLTVVTPPERGESAEQSIRRAARPVLARFGIPEKKLKVPLQGGRGPHVDAHHLVFPEYMVDGVYVATGADVATRDATGLDPADPANEPFSVQLGDLGSGHFVRVHTVVAAHALPEALAIAFSRAESVEANHIEVLPAAGNGYLAALVSVAAARPGETETAGLRRAVAEVAARLQLGACQPVVVRDLPSGPVAVLAAEGGVVYARNGRDPFNHTDPPQPLRY
jgi:hypothetical protein